MAANAVVAAVQTPNVVCTRSRDVNLRRGSASRAAPASRPRLRLLPSVPRRVGRWLAPGTTIAAVGSEAGESSALSSELCELAKEFVGAWVCFPVPDLVLPSSIVACDPRRSATIYMIPPSQ